jgi:uncharacterized protein YbjT (DUF2867 family)
MTGRVLVVGATGPLGSAITRKLIARGVPVRALARNRAKLEALGGAEVAAVDMLDLQKLTDACRGVTQIVATATNNMGTGPTSPTRVDLSAYQNQCAAMRNTGVTRLVYTSFRGADQFAPVDIFRLKWYIEDAIRRSGVKYVMLRPTAFMDIWVDELLAADIRKKGVATIFGSGTHVSNYVAVDDVAEFAVRILEHEEIVNEAIEIGSPSDISLNDLASLIETRQGKTAKRRHIPVAAMKFLPYLVRPFNEVAARLMTIGYYAATESRPFPGWQKAADRFGIQPRTIEAYVNALPADPMADPR